MREALRSAFPEMAVGGYTRRDGTVEFFFRVNSLLHPDMRVLDLGAGRGRWQDDEIRVRRELCRLRGKVARVVGADIDPAVLANAGLDEAVLLRQGEPLPFGDASFDMVIADHVIEHIDEPEGFSSEVTRILKPGGWFCARTPSRWGSTGIATNLIPNQWHVRVLQRLQPKREAADVFPTRYRLNTRRAVARAFPGWGGVIYLFTPEPGYLAFSRTAVALGRLIDAVLPGSVLLIFSQKPLEGPS